MKNRIYLFAFATLITAALALPNMAFGTLIIDNFVAGETLSQFGAGSTSQVTIDSSILGKSRIDRLTVRDQGGQEFFGAMGFGGDLSIGQGSNDRISGSMNYNNLGTGIDLTEGGFNDRFSFTFVNSDADVQLSDVMSLLVISNGTKQIIDLSIPKGSDLPQNVEIAFEKFTDIDFSSVTGLELLFDFQSYPGRDFVLSSFAAKGGPSGGVAVPEPASAMVVIALGSLVALRRRRS